MSESHAHESIRVYLNAESLERLHALRDYTMVAQTTLLSWIVAAGLEALSEQQKIVLPLKFAVVPPPKKNGH